jgi:hypothetical protein
MKGQVVATAVALALAVAIGAYMDVPTALLFGAAALASIRLSSRLEAYVAHPRWGYVMRAGSGAVAALVPSLGALSQGVGLASALRFVSVWVLLFWLLMAARYKMEQSLPTSGNPPQRGAPKCDSGGDSP